MATASENSLMSQLYRRKRALLRHCYEVLGADWLQLPDDAKRAKVVECAFERGYFREGGFWKEVLKGGEGQDRWTRRELAEIVNRIMECLEGAKQATATTRLNEEKLGHIFNNQMPLVAPIRRAFDWLSGGKLEPQDVELLGLLPVGPALPGKTPFAKKLDELMGENINIVDVGRNNSHDHRMGRISTFESSDISAVRLYGGQLTLQKLHGLMIGLENSGVSRAQLIAFARDCAIPYDPVTGCVLPSIHEVIGDIYKGGKKSLPSVVLQAMRTARDVSLSELACAKQIDLSLSGYHRYERPTSRNHPTLDQIQAERVFDLFNRILALRNDRLTERECRQASDVMADGYASHTVWEDARNDQGWASMAWGCAPEDEPLRKGNGPDRPKTRAHVVSSEARPLP